MRRNGFSAGSFLLGLVIGIAILVLVAFAISTNSTLAFNRPAENQGSTPQATAAPGELQRERGGEPSSTVVVNARQMWNDFVAAIASIPQAIINWVRSIENSTSEPRIVITPVSP